MRRLQIALAFAAGIVLSSLTALAWTGPASAPPNGNVFAPINVGSTDQTKNANLGVNGLAVFGNTILSGTSPTYLNFGATAGTNGYGIRDNSGSLEFKNSGGAWNNFTNTVLNVLGAGAVTQIKFSDGTTQTTAPTSFSSGSWCGVSIVNSGTYNSDTLNGSFATASIPCLGENPISACPTGFSQLFIRAISNASDNSSDYVVSCIKN